MSIESALIERSNNKCELCGSPDNLSVYPVPPIKVESIDESILTCSTCNDQITNPENMDADHWRCLNDSIWSPVPAVQVMAWRILNYLKAEGWPQDLLDMLYLEDELKSWAEADNLNQDTNEGSETKDSNGTTLNAGDSVTIIKDLVVKGANFTAKRGSLVKNISLTSNSKHIEGRVNGTRIVLVSAFLKKA